MRLAVAKIGNTKVLLHITFLLAGITLIGTGYALYFVVLVGSLLVHETGHLIAASFLDLEVREVEVWAFGAVARLDGVGQIEPWPEAIVAISGPLQSALLAGLGFLALLGFSAGTPEMQILGRFPLLEFLVRMNLGLFTMNLLPCPPLDGGRFLRAQLSLKIGYRKASDKVSKIGIYVGAGITGLGFLGIFGGRQWYSLLILGPLLIWGAREEREKAAFTNVMMLLSRSQRLAKTGVLPVEELMVYHDARVSELVHRLRPSRYYLLVVVDKQMNIMASVSETRLLEAFCKGYMSLSMEELINREL